MSVFDGYFTPPGKQNRSVFSFLRSNTRTRRTGAVDRSVPASARLPGSERDASSERPRLCSSAFASGTAETCRTRASRVPARRGRDREAETSHHQRRSRSDKSCFWIVASIAWLVLMLPPHPARAELVANALHFHVFSLTTAQPVSSPPRPAFLSRRVWDPASLSFISTVNVSNRSLTAQYVRRPRQQENAPDPSFAL